MWFWEPLLESPEVEINEGIVLKQLCKERFYWDVTSRDREPCHM